VIPEVTTTLNDPLYVAFVWHMHQPYYRDDLLGSFVLPWTRLRATKDYLHMAEVLAQHPDIHATFNLVPSLVEQILEYVDHGGSDEYLSVSLKEEWSPEDKDFMLSFFFSANWGKFIQPHPAYDRLLQIREKLRDRAQYLSDQYFRDLAAWFNLVWIDPNWLEREPVLRAFIGKGTGFSNEDIRTITSLHEKLLGRTINAYREMEDRGQIEMCTSPYYHPILPLLIDSQSAREATPDISLPNPIFAHPEDAVAQIKRALQFHEKHFGRSPQGLWPPEGSVSDALLALLAEHTDIRWIASDEAVLARSAGQEVYRDGYGHVTNPRFLYQPYRVSDGNGSRGPAIVFRDNLLSDRIGFVYQHMDSRQAAADMVHRLQRIRENLGDSGPHLVSIILDGENCWDEYEHNGDPFLHSLYEMLSDDPLLATVTISEYLSTHPVQATLPHLFAGSWIGHNFETWIGEPAQNRAWEQLEQTRRHLVAWQAQHPEADEKLVERTWTEIYIAEGSDWFWWHSSRNRATEESLFDNSFRQHLANVYSLTGQMTPEWLLEKGLAPVPESPSRLPSTYLSPLLEANRPAFPRWAHAGYVSPRSSSGAMQMASTLIKGLYYGYDHDNLFVRVDSSQPLHTCTISILLSVINHSEDKTPHTETTELLGQSLLPGQYEIQLRPDANSASLRRAGADARWDETANLPLSLAEQTLELRIPLLDIGSAQGDTLIMRVLMSKDDSVTETLPTHENLEIRLSSFN